MQLKEPTDDVMERILAAAHRAGPGSSDVVVSTYKHNACNHTYSGEIDVDGERYAFVIDSGDWNGTVIHEWCHPDEAKGFTEPEPPEPRTFVPVNDNLNVTVPAMFRAYGLWRLESWFKDMERAYNYDRHFAPGVKTEAHYTEQAAKRGLRPGYLSSLDADSIKVLQEMGAAPKVIRRD